MYHSDTNARSSRSIASTLKDDSPSIYSEEDASNSSSQKSYAQDEASMAHKKSTHSKDMALPSRSSSLSPPQSRSSNGTAFERSLNSAGNSNSNNNGNEVEPRQRNVIHLSSDNYDTTVFKTGWVNKSHGQTVATNYNSSMTAPTSTSTSSSQNLRNDAYSRNRESRFYGNDSSSSKNDDNTNSSTISNGNDIASTRSSMALDPQMLVPDYRLYRAQLKGCVLNLYKSGLNSNVKFFDPSLPASNNNIANENHQQKKQQTNLHAQAEAQLQRQSSDQVGEPITLELKYLSEVYPHPDLKLDNEGKIISGTIESLCHAVLFYSGSKHSGIPSEKSLSKTHRTVINLLLMFPLIDQFIKFLKICNQFGLSFTKNRSRLTNNSCLLYTSRCV